MDVRTVRKEFDGIAEKYTGVQENGWEDQMKNDVHSLFDQILVRDLFLMTLAVLRYEMALEEQAHRQHTMSILYNEFVTRELRIVRMFSRFMVEYISDKLFYVE